MTTELAPLLEAVDRLAQAMLTGVPFDKRLWTAEACAQYLSYSTAHFLARIACRPDCLDCLRQREPGRTQE